MQAHGAGGAHIAAAAAATGAATAAIAVVAVYLGLAEFVFVIAHGLSSESHILGHIASGYYMQKQKSLCVSQSVPYTDSVSIILLV